VIDLATRLVTAQLAERENSTNAGERLALDHSSYDHLFAGAMRRAERILLGPAADPSTIFAEQLFEPHEVFSAKEIAERFGEWGWPNFSAENTVKSWIKKFALWMNSSLLEDEARFEEQLGETGGAMRDFLNDLFRYCETRGRKTETNEIPPEVHALANAIRHFTLQYLNDPALDQSAVQLNMLRQQMLTQWCFADRSPAHWLDGPSSEAQSPEDRDWLELSELVEDSTLRCRPGALFQYVRIYGEDQPETKELFRKISVPRRELTSDMTPPDLLEEFGNFTGFDPRFDEYIQRSVAKAHTSQAEPKGDL
jgi:hypothetical protein